MHKTQNRQGPGSKETSLKVFDLTGFSPKDSINILDIGCVTGAQTIDLVKNTSASVLAVDIYDEFLEQLEIKANQLGLSNKIKTLNSSMDNLELPKKYFDLVWAEGSAYILGFSRAISNFKEFLRPGGVIAVSEICWFTKKRPTEIEKYWNAIIQKWIRLIIKLKF